MISKITKTFEEIYLLYSNPPFFNQEDAWGYHILRFPN